MQPERIFIEHNAKVLADLAGAERPACDGIITALGRPDQVIASTVRSNPLSGHVAAAEAGAQNAHEPDAAPRHSRLRGNDEGPWLMDVHSPGRRVVTWSGTLAADLNSPHPMTWLSPGHHAFRAFCDEIDPQLQRHGRTLCFHPHARHVLNDPPSCLRFLRDRAEGPFEIALATATMLEPSMMNRVEDHLTRAFEALGGVCAMVMLSDAAPDDDGNAVEAVPLGRGVLPRETVLALIDQHVPPHIAIVLQPAHMDEQSQWLGLSATAAAHRDDQEPR